MMQVQIKIDFNVDLKSGELVPGVFEGKLVLNTSHGERFPLCEFRGNGGIERAQEMATDWINANMFDFANPNCRPLRYLKVAEGARLGIEG